MDHVVDLLRDSPLVGTLAAENLPVLPIRVAVMRSAIFLALTLAGCSPVLFTVNGVPNFREVESGLPPGQFNHTGKSGLYRGGEPTAEGWAYLKSLNVCRVLQLDEDNEQPAGSKPPAGIEVVRVPMPPSDADDLFKGPTADQFNEAVVSIWRHWWDQQGWPAEPCAMYVHCRWGRDRTGLVIAGWRTLRGWTKQAAFAEAVRLGFHRALFGLMRTWREWRP